MSLVRLQIFAAFLNKFACYLLVILCFTYVKSFSPMLLQVLASGAGSEAAAAPGGGLQGARDLAGVSCRGSAELHQPGLSQLRAHQPEPQRPRTIQL